jgi:hypothetical protein
LTTELPPLSRAGRLRAAGRAGGFAGAGRPGGFADAGRAGGFADAGRAGGFADAVLACAVRLRAAEACFAAFGAVDRALAGAGLARCFAVARGRGERARAIATDAIMTRRAHAIRAPRACAPARVIDVSFPHAPAHRRRDPRRVR